MSGHIDNPELAGQVDQIVQAKGQELVDALEVLGVKPSYANASGPTGSVNYLATVPAEDVPAGTSGTGAESPPAAE